MTIDGRTSLYGLLGWPVGHSLSPAMHAAAAADLGLNLAYLPLLVQPDDLPAAVRGLAALGFRGANVTVPHKETIRPLLDALSAEARAIGAVNTLVLTPDGTVGHNTDWTGFGDDLAALGVSPDGRDCLVLGAGGSARAVVYALRAGGGRVRVLARRPQQAAALAAAMDRALPDPQPVMAGPLADVPAFAATTAAPLIVNTTPLGLAPAVDGTPWPEGVPFPPGAFAYDLVYNPARTRFIAQAEAAGCRTANGLGMLVRQAAAAFALWTGHTPDLSVMRRAAEDALDAAAIKESTYDR